MNRQVWRGHSAGLGAEVRVARWGHYGRPVLWMSAAGGDALEAERYQLIEPLAPLIEAGRIKLYAADSLGNARWLGQDPGLNARYLRFLGEQVCPLMHEDSGHTPQRFLVVGASLGAVDALCAGLAWPGWFAATLALSPARFAPFGDPVGTALQALLPAERTALAGRKFHLYTGSGHLEDPSEARRLQRLLEGAGLSAPLERAGGDAGHDHGAWRARLPRLLESLA